MVDPDLVERMEQWGSVKLMSEEAEAEALKLEPAVHCSRITN
jgi:hypothetical protein